MSIHGPNSPAGQASPAPGWRGRKPNEPPPIQHGWQVARPEAAERSLMPGDHRLGLKVAGFLAVSIMLFGLLLFLLLFRPEQTPLIGAAVTGYSWPVPPNAWAVEDLTALSTLDGETLQQVNLSPAWQSKELGLRNLEEQLRSAADRSSHLGAVIIYLSMHGMVDGRGEPCLLTPDASPLASETWLPVRTLLERIKAQQLPSKSRLLLVLDCNRFDAQWSLGQLYNGFAERLPAAIEQAAVPNLVVLNSTGPGQVGWSSSELRGSVFGHYLMRGLAGEADTAGNRNRLVTLRELHGYLQTEVRRWVAKNRLDVQQPMLIPANAADFGLAWSLGSKLPVQPASASQSATPSVTDVQLAELWRKHDELLAFDPVRFDPLAWRDFQQKILWLEQLASSGVAYAPLAGSAAVELDQLAAGMLRRAQAAPRAAVLPLGNAFSLARAPLPKQVTAHDLPLLELMGTVPPEALAKVRGGIAQFAATPTSQTLDQFDAAIAAIDGLPSPGVSEAQFLSVLRHNLPPEAWKRGDLLARVAQLRVLAETAATPSDERVQLWIRDAVEAGDDARRRAEDALLVGTPEALDDATEEVARAMELYQSAVAAAEALTQAIKSRDQAWDELPAIARWYSRRLPVEDSSQELDRRINDDLLPLIEATHVLGSLLSHSPSVARSQLDVQHVADNAAKVRQSLDGLRQGIIDPRRCRELSETTEPDPRALREIESLLATPLLPARTRTELRRTRQNLTSQIDRGASTVEAIPEIDITQFAAARVNRMAVTWKRHPASAILSRWKINPSPGDEPWPLEPIDPNSAGGVLALAGKGEQVRDLLSTIPQQIQELLEIPQDFLADTSDEASPVTDSGHGKPLHSAQIRDGVCRAERLIRAAAAFGFPPASIGIISRLRTLDVHQALLWKAIRTLDDFYASEAGRQPPYFATAAEGYLRSAQSLDLLGWAPRQEEQRVQLLLDERQQAATHGFKLFAADLVLIDDGEPVTEEIAVQTQTAKVDIPTGQAAVFVSDAAGRIDASTQALSLPLSGESETAVSQTLVSTLSGEELSRRAAQLSAVLLFRGHRFTHDFLARPPDGIKTIYDRPFYDTARVALRGNDRKPGSVMLILDCSSSMRELTTVEGPDGSRQVERMQIAKDALLGMLERLATDGGYRVGVRFFGHRVKRNLNNPREILQEPRYGRPIPPGLLPSEDVELVLPLGRFRPNDLDDLAALLDTVRPCGETPLYLAMLQAQQDLANEDPGSQRSIVVITDGANNQYNSPDPRSEADVLAASAGRSIQIHVVGFQLPAADAAVAQREFTEIATQTGGKYFPAANATALTQYLEGLLGDATWRVVDLQGREIGERTVGYAIDVPTPDPFPRKFTIEAGEGDRLVKSEVDLTGGEALEPQLTADGRRIEYRRYDRESPVFQPLVTGGAQRLTGLLLGAHRPDWEGPLLRFPISIQSDSAKFTPRPLEVWAEITPVTIDHTARLMPLVFVDPNWTSDRPVPVLKCVASNWPSSARQAEIRFWCKPLPTPPDMVVTVAEAMDRQRRALSSVPGDLAPGVTHQVKVKPGESASDPLRIAVLERHGEGSPDLAALRTDLLPAADRIERLYDPVNRLSLHTFEYFHVDESEALNFEIRVTTRRSCANDAYLLAEPIRINVPESGDVIRLAPPTAPRLSDGPELPVGP